MNYLEIKNMVNHKVDALELSKKLIKCESITPEDGGSQLVLGDALKSIGFNCENIVFGSDNTPDVSNLYARFGTELPNFAFAGHTDVVPVGDESEWHVKPFEGIVKEGFLYGRGASDMKTAIACFVEASSRLIEKYGTNFGGSISLLITGDEEGPAINGTQKLLEWAKSRGETFTACLVGEPTNPEKLGEMIKIGRRGSLNGQLTVHGVQGHTAYPHLADNPIHHLIKMLDAITADPLDNGSEHFQASTIQISSIDVGNSTTNVIPSKATANFNIRYNELHTSESLKQFLHDTLGQFGNKFNLDIAVSGESFITPPGPLSEIISEAAELVTGKKPELSTTGGTSDARFIKDYCPVAEFGLIGRTMHKANECVSIKDLEALTQIYTNVLEKFFNKHR
tara:strand:- start:40443 stop:41630 length:1188 start_codon:yes stop_codon:yes gene_type:complete